MPVGRSVDGCPTALAERRGASDDPHMEQIERLIDVDRRSLDERVDRALRRHGDCEVRSFTYFFTGRPAVHEAVLLRADGARRAG